MKAETKFNQNLSIELFEKILNQSATIKGKEAYFTCPSCNKPNKLSVNINTYAYHCFVCEDTLKPVIKALLKEEYNHTTNNNYYQPTPKEQLKNEIKTPDITKELELISNFPIIPGHRQLFLKKRGFEPGHNFISLTPDLVEAVKAINPKLSSDLKYYLNQNYHLIILYRDTENKPFTLRFYSFAPKVTRPKKLSLKGQKTAIYGLENITSETKYIYFVEGEEVSEAGNLYSDKTIVFLSIPGMGIHNPAIEFVRQNLKYNYGVLFDNENRKNERVATYKLGTKILEITDKCFVLELPCKKNEKVDLDSYLKPFPENDRPEELKKVLNEAYPLQDYKSKYSKDVSKDFDRKKPVITLQKPVNIQGKEVLTIDQVREALPEVIKNFISNPLNSNDVLLIKTPPGTGKTHAIIETIKEYKLRISAINRTLRNEIAEKAGIDKNISLDEHCLNTLNKYSDKLTPEEKEKNLIESNKLTSKGHNPYKKYCPHNCKIEQYCKDEKPQQKTGSIAETHDKTLMDVTKNVKKSDALVIDESIFKAIIGTQKIDYAEINRMIEFYTGSLELDLILKTFNQLLDTAKENLSGKNLFDVVRAFFKEEHLNFKDLVNTLDKSLIEDNKLIFESEKLPDRKSLTALLFTLETNFRSSNLIYDNFTEKCYFEINYSKHSEFETIDKPIICLDATGDMGLLKMFFPGKNIQVYDPPVDIPGLKITMIPDKTFTASTLFRDKNNPENAVITQLINHISKDNDTLVMCKTDTENILKKVFKERIETENNLTFDHFFGSGSRGSNGYSEKEICIVTNPPVNMHENIPKIARIFFDSINTELTYKNVPTGKIDSETGLEINVSNIFFQDKRLNVILKQFREAETFQSLFRVKRDTSSKEFFILNNISLKEFNIIPDEIILSKDILKQDKKEKHSEFKNAIQELVNYALNEQGFLLKKELYDLYPLQNFTDGNTPQTLVNIQKPEKCNNIYSLFMQKTGFLTFIRDTANGLKRTQFNDLVKNSLSDMQLIEKNFPIKEQPNSKILLRSETNFETAKVFYKDILIHEPVKISSVLTSESIPGKNINEEILKEDPAAKTLLFRNLIQNYDPVSSIFFGYVKETLKNHTGNIFEAGQEPEKITLENINKLEVKEEVTESEYINSLIYLLGTEVNEPDLNLNSISQSFVECQVTPEVIEQLEENYKMSEDSEEEFIKAFDNHCIEKAPELDKLVQTIIQKRLSDNLPFDFDYLSKLEDWNDALPDEPTPAKFNRIFIYKFFTDNFESLQERANINTEIKPDTITPEKVFTPENSQETNDYIKTLMDIIPAKLMMDYKTYFTAIAKNSFDKNISLSEALKGMNVEILRIQNQDTRPRNNISYSQPKTAINARENKSGTITLEQVETKQESQPLTSEVIEQRIKDYKFDNQEWLEGIKNLNIFNHISKIYDKSKKNDFDYFRDVAEQLTFIFDISFEKASLYLANYEFISPVTLKIHELSMKIEYIDLYHKTFYNLVYSNTELNEEYFKKLKAWFKEKPTDKRLFVYWQIAHTYKNILARRNILNQTIQVHGVINSMQNN